MTGYKIANLKMISLAVLIGIAATMALASGKTDDTSLEKLRQFLAAHPQVARAVAEVEVRTGGKVTEAAFDDNGNPPDVVEFDVAMADGSEQEVLYKLAEAAMTVIADDIAEDGDKEVASD